MCPDSAAAWPALRSLVVTAANVEVAVRLHLLPLPYHHNAHFAATSMYIVAKYVKFFSPIAFLDKFFAQQTRFFNSVTANMTATQVIVQLASFAETNFGLAPKVFASAWNSGDFDEAARVGWKEVVSWGAYETPEHRVNGVFLVNNTIVSLAQWQQIIDPLLQR